MSPSRISLACCALLACTIQSRGVPAADMHDEQELHRVTQELVDAVAPGDKAVWDRYLDEHFMQMDENGELHNKPELLKLLEPLPPGLEGHIKIDEYQVNFYGDTAIAAYQLQESLDYYGQTLYSRFRSLDTWRKTSAGWRLIGQHTAAVLQDPPAIAMPKAQLCEYAGTYTLTDTIKSTLRCTESGLTAERKGHSSVTYLVELRDVFFVPGQPRTRRIFFRSADGHVSGFVDRREGKDIHWMRAADEALQDEHNQ